MIFVYNAHAGAWNGLLDLLHKHISPGTYPCNLCAITYTNTGMRSEWKAFIESLPVPVTFLHKNEWSQYPGHLPVPLPAAFLVSGNKVYELISKSEMDRLGSVPELIAHTNDKLKHSGIV